MKRSIAAGFVALMVAGSMGGCSFGDDEPTYQLPTAPIILDVPTQPPASATDCPQTALAPVKLIWDATHRSLSFGGQGFSLPWGFTGRELPSGHFELLAPNGDVVARDGDTLTLGGTDYMQICRIQSVEY